MNEIPQLRLDTSLVNNLIGNMVHVDGGFLTIRIPPKQGYVECPLAYTLLFSLSFVCLSS